MHSFSRGVLTEQAPKVLYDAMPVIWLKPGKTQAWTTLNPWFKSNPNICLRSELERSHCVQDIPPHPTFRVYPLYCHYCHFRGSLLLYTCIYMYNIPHPPPSLLPSQEGGCGGQRRVRVSSLQDQCQERHSLNHRALH